MYITKHRLLQFFGKNKLQSAVHQYLYFIIFNISHLMQSMEVRMNIKSTITNNVTCDFYGMLASSTNTATTCIDNVCIPGTCNS